MAVKIFAVLKNSACARNGIRPGDKLISINGNEINDVLDYRFYSDSDKIRAVFELNDGTVKNVSLRAGNGVDKLGLAFETYLMDKHRRCKNSCIFCFIDQLPKGLRESLYFKDDDSRLSFLFGNYITLTNLTEKDVDRIIRMHISPINASVHTMNPELRVKMMKNPSAGSSLGYLKRFSDAGITINAQLVLCPGINDGKELEFSLSELGKLYPAVQSIACVPVGLTKHRDGLYPLEMYNEKTASAVIDTVDDFNAHFKYYKGETIAFAADEFYLCAGREIPSADYYGEYPQLENGVGMWRLLEDEFASALEDSDFELSNNRNLTAITGAAAYPLIKKLADMAKNKYNKLKNALFILNNATIWRWQI